MPVSEWGVFIEFYDRALPNTMSDGAAASAPAVTKTPKKKSAKSKKPSTHPKYSEMIQKAIANLKERGGSSRQAIMKYITKNYTVGKDERVVNQHLKMALRAGVKNNTLKQAKGTGAAGSFRLGEAKSASKKSKKAAKKPKSDKKPQKPKAKKPAAKKPKAKKEKKEKKKPKSPKKAKTPKKPTSAKPKKPKAAKKSPAKKANKPKKAAKAKKTK